MALFGITEGFLVVIFTLGIVFLVGAGSNSIGADENLIQNWSHGGPH